MATLTTVYTADLTKDQLDLLDYTSPAKIEVDQVSTGGYVFCITSEGDMVSPPEICKDEKNVPFDSIEEALFYAFGDPETYAGAEWSDWDE